MILRIIRVQAALSRKYALRTYATRSVANLFDRGFIKEVFPPDSRFVLVPFKKCIITEFHMIFQTQN